MTDVLYLLLIGSCVILLGYSLIDLVQSLDVDLVKIPVGILIIMGLVGDQDWFWWAGLLAGIEFALLMALWLLNPDPKTLLLLVVFGFVLSPVIYAAFLI